LILNDKAVLLCLYLTQNYTLDTTFLIESPSMNQSTLSEVILNARLSLRLAQTEVAAHLGVAQSTYNNWESGKHIPSSKHIPKLCQILKLETHDVLPSAPTLM